MEMCLGWGRKTRTSSTEMLLLNPSLVTDLPWGGRGRLHQQNPHGNAAREGERGTRRLSPAPHTAEAGKERDLGSITLCAFCSGLVWVFFSLQAKFCPGLEGRELLEKCFCSLLKSSCSQDQAPAPPRT